MKIKKVISLILILFLIIEILCPIIPRGVFASENADINEGQTQVANEEQTSKEVSREYEIKEEETWDISENGDGSVIAKWTLSDRTLRISGNGEMKNWQDNNEKEDWHNSQYTNIVQNVVIDEGIKNIGDNAFYRCINLKSVKIPESVTEIGSDVFLRCSKLEAINVNADNENYMSENGILFNKSKTEIIKYPSNKKDINEYKIPEKVTKIEEYTFSGCSSLTNIEIPEGVTEIGKFAFEGCSSLARIEIPEGVMKIESGAFSGCSSLTNIKIPEGVTEIGNYAFEGCSSLINIKIPEEVTEIGIGTFSGCSSFTRIEIPEGVTEIGQKAFYGCSSLTNIEIPEEVTKIEIGAFKECRSLTNIEMPEGITEIRGGAFEECSSLINIEIPEGVIKIESGAFEGCSSLTNIKIPEGVTEIGQRAFYGCSNLIMYVQADSVGHKYAEENKNGYILNGEVSIVSTEYEIKEEETWDISENGDGRVIAKWTLSDKTLRISGTGKMKKWSGSEKEDWHNSQYTNIIENVVIENGIINIGAYAFEECSSLTNVEIPEGVIEIEWYAFRECSSLTNIEIPEGVTEIGWYIFPGCSKLEAINVNANNENYMSENGILFNKNKTEIIKYPANKKDINEYKIPEKVTKIEKYTFEECSSLTNIEIPKGVTEIGEYAFLGCSSLTNIKIPDGVTYIGRCTFSGCSSLTNIKIPDRVTGINDRAFSGCSSLTSIKIPDGVTEIEEYTFSGCSNLTNIEIPEGVTEIGEYAFAGCSSLTNIKIPDRVTGINDGAFSECSGLTSIKMPDGVTYIGWYTFSGCNSLTNIEIPEGVTEIRGYAFLGCRSLTNIEIPENVMSIGEGVFSNCNNIDGILLTEKVTNLARDAIDKSIIIYAKSNGVVHEYAEKEKHGYILDEKGPDIKILTDKVITNQKQTLTIPVEVKDNYEFVGVKEGTIKYAISDSNTQAPSDEEFTNNVTEGKITYEMQEGKKYIWVSAEDNLGNVSKVVSQELNLDLIAPKLEVEKTPTEKTNQKVTVTIKANEEIQKPEGWELSSDNKTITKEYTENIEETVTIKDLAGNETKQKITINNIDKTAPEVEVSYSTTEETEGSVTVEIQANEELQSLTGWNLSTDQKKLTREYSRNTKETVTVKDIAGNEKQVEINIQNIKTPIKIGDINADDKIDITDIILLKRHLIAGNRTNWILTGDNLESADMNENGKVDISDLLLVKREVAQNI